MQRNKAVIMKETEPKGIQEERKCNQWHYLYIAILCLVPLVHGHSEAGNNALAHIEELLKTKAHIRRQQNAKACLPTHPYHSSLQNLLKERFYGGQRKDGADAGIFAFHTAEDDTDTVLD